MVHVVTVVVTGLKVMNGETHTDDLWCHIHISRAGPSLSPIREIRSHLIWLFRCPISTIYTHQRQRTLWFYREAELVLRGCWGGRADLLKTGGENSGQKTSDKTEDRSEFEERVACGQVRRRGGVWLKKRGRRVLRCLTGFTKSFKLLWQCHGNATLSSSWESWQQWCENSPSFSSCRAGEYRKR